MVQPLHTSPGGGETGASLLFHRPKERKRKVRVRVRMRMRMESPSLASHWNYWKENKKQESFTIHANIHDISNPSLRFSEGKKVFGFRLRTLCAAILRPASYLDDVTVGRRNRNVCFSVWTSFFFFSSFSFSSSHCTVEEEELGGRSDHSCLGDIPFCCVFATLFRFLWSQLQRGVREKKKKRKKMGNCLKCWSASGKYLFQGLIVWSWLATFCSFWLCSTDI